MAKKLERGNSGPMTEARWQMVDFAIKAFFSKFPQAFTELYKHEMQEARHGLNDPTYGLASRQHKQLRAASFRHTAAFPVLWNAEKQQEESLLPVLEKFIPDLITDDKKYHEFLRRYPFFKVADKV